MTNAYSIAIVFVIYQPECRYQFTVIYRFNFHHNTNTEKNI